MPGSPPRLAGSTPDFTGLTLHLAAHRPSPPPFAEVLAALVDRLLESTAAEDWKEVRRLGDHLARASARHGYPLIRQRAEAMRDAMEGDDPAAMRRDVLRLIGACGRIGRPGAAAA